MLLLSKTIGIVFTNPISHTGSLAESLFLKLYHLSHTDFLQLPNYHAGIICGSLYYQPCIVTTRSFMWNALKETTVKYLKSINCYRKKLEQLFYNGIYTIYNIYGIYSIQYIYNIQWYMPTFQGTVPPIAQEEVIMVMMCWPPKPDDTNPSDAIEQAYQ